VECLVARKGAANVHTCFESNPTKIYDDD